MVRVARQCAAQVVESGRLKTADSKVEPARAGLRRKGERVNADGTVQALASSSSRRTWKARLPILRGDGQSRHRRIAPRARRPVELEVGGSWSVRVHCGFDERPAQMRGARLGEVAAAAALTRLIDDRVEAGQPGDLLGAAEAARLADLGERVAGEDRSDPVDRLQRLAALVR